MTASFFTEEQSKDFHKLLLSRESYVGGVAGSASAVMLAAMKVRSVASIVISSDADSAGYMYHDLTRLLGEEKVAFMPSGYRRALKYGQADPPARILRTETLNALSDPHSGLRFVVTYPEALAERVASRDDLQTHTLNVAVNCTLDLTQTEKWLIDNGFVRVDYVYEPGQFAIRGSILDIFGYASELPCRIDLFGDEVESIRTFNIETQLSETRLDNVSIIADVKNDSDKGLSLLDFVSEKTLLIVSSGTDPVARVRNVAAEGFAVNAVHASEGTDGGSADAVKDIVDTEAFADVYARMRRLTFSGAEISSKIKNSLNLACSPQGIYHKNFELIADNFKRLLSEGYKLYILSDQPKQFDRLRAIFEDRGDNISFIPIHSTLHEGFVNHATKCCVFTDHQIFDRFHKYTLRSDRARTGKLALSLKELAAIEVGDYVVHIDHGVGKFGGLLRTNVNGHTQEMIKLIYQNDDIVFVSIHALHKLSKYRGKEGVPPRINKLGSGAWNKLKDRTKSKLKDIARDLIRLYATRKEQKGFAFSPDSYLQHELEASFIYEDTPDQLTATRAVKADMESDKPMDRLICGDVGFGKTEIAIRAAFKAATDGKQTAVLVPTTVLAYQHFNTFKERLANFPVRVEYLSRARTPSQTRQILADLQEGKIDIIIGTHKLISKSVKFKDLGLLVVDEEQKFGVAVKEKLKQLKTNVDTLTMSATPIPRTLQFSLMGARDLSSLNTPPANRYPILTTVSTLSDEILLEATNFELSRNGQIFIVNDRIEGLYRLKDKVQQLVPDARIVVAHGQMPPEDLEKAILDFTNHDYDILLATTIVESGIDMPNVNTIIVNNAHHFGLSELHQLRGRVGRSSRKAFAYLMVPPDEAMTPVARRRLQAIEAFSDLGSGIHIAMQDLDIRGAGNLLGAEQSGFIADLGYETYQKILREAMLELNTQEFADTETAKGGAGLLNEEGDAEYVADTVIESDMEVLLPADYVPQESERINLYRELDSIEQSEDLKAFEQRLVDRFGPIPEVTRQLLYVPRLRRLARRFGIEKINLKNGLMYIYFVDTSNKAYYQSPMFGRLLHYLQLNSRRSKIREQNGRPSFVISDVHTMEEAYSVLDTAILLPPV
ncbi:MAG: transcription-repair coupling factor [Muribaculaceae bacterium]|nr:transcription-repair coupling factor [Muribaculaceae bacterium]